MNPNRKPVLKYEEDTDIGNSSYHSRITVLDHSPRKAGEGNEQNVILNRDQQIAGIDGDPIVKVLKVIAVIQDEKTLHLFQFPTYRVEDRRGIVPVSAKAKIQADLLELEYDLVTDPRVYNEEHAIKLASCLNANQRDKTNRIHKMTTMALSSSKISRTGQYYVAMIDDDYLYLNPVTYITQFRPDLHYIDRMDEKKDEVVHTELSEKEDGDSDYEEQSRVLSVTVESNDEMQNKLLRLSQLAQDAESEIWAPLDLKCYSTNTEVLQALCPRGVLHSMHNTNLSSAVGNIGLPVREDTTSSPRASYLKTRSVVPLSVYRNYTLEGMIFSYMANVVLTRFDTLKSTINVFDEEEILKILTKCAVLVNGIWIIKSELVYKGLPLLARKWLLYMLSTFTHVKRAEFSSTCKLPYEICTSILSELAILVPKVGWRLKLNEDIGFC